MFKMVHYVKFVPILNRFVLYGRGGAKVEKRLNASSIVPIVL